MKTKVNIKPEHLKIVLDILHKHLTDTTIVWVFGSRAKGAAKKYSDLDLAIDAGKPLSKACIVDLSFDFEESDLPYKVDIVDWAEAEEQFKKVIGQSRIELSGPPTFGEK